MPGKTLNECKHPTNCMPCFPRVDEVKGVARWKVLGTSGERDLCILLSWYLVFIPFLSLILSLWLRHPDPRKSSGVS